MKRSIWLGVVVLIVVIAAGGGGYWFAMRQMMSTMTAADTGSASAAQEKDGRKVLYWHDPMVPAQKFDKQIGRASCRERV